MYIRRALAAALVAIILSGIPALADYSDAEYRGTVNIANAGAAVSGVTVKLTTNTQAFIDSGILDASFNNVWFDSAAGAALAFMPKPGAISEWYFYYPYSLAATATTLSYLYMGGPDMSAPLYYLPGATGMSTVDHATIEPAADVDVEVNGYVALPADNTITPLYLVNKTDTLALWNMQDGIMAMVCTGGSAFNTYYSSATGSTDPGAIWTDEAAAYDNNTATGADLGSTPATSWSQFLILDLDFAPNPTFPGLQFHAEYDAASWSQVDIDVYYGGAWHDIYQGVFDNLTNVPKWLAGAYAVSDVRLRFYNCAATAQTETDLLREVQWLNGHNNRTVLFAPCTSGEHTVTFEYNGTATLSLDGVLAATKAHPAGGALNNNGNAWVMVDDASMAYMEYAKIWQGGTLRQHIEWKNAATFTDLSGNGNTATPSFPAASSDPDVTATLAAMAPIDPAEAPGTSTDSGSSMSGTLPTVPDNLFGELDADMEDIPGVAVVNAILDAGDIPRALFWFLFVFAAIVGLCLLTYHLSKSLMAMSLVAGAGMLFASKIGIVPYWVTIPLVLIALAVLVKEKMSPL
jgi:hypothetical protein